MDYQFLTTTPLFHGMNETEIKALLPRLSARDKKYRKGSIIYHAGNKVSEIGLILSGSVNIVVNFYWGSSNIFGHIGQGDIFAENYAAVPGRKLLNDVVAAETTEVLFLNLNNLLTTCKKGCAFHNGIIHNLIKISAMKNLNLSSRMMHTASKSIRDRVLSYLSECALKSGSMRFSIPFSRQELADYLGVDRSALSGELSKMQRDGLIEFRKSDFTLLEDSYLYE